MATANQFRQKIPEIVVGISADVSEQPRRTPVPLVLAVTFENDGQQLAYEGVLRQVAQFLPPLIRKRQTARREMIVEALLPDM